MVRFERGWPLSRVRVCQTGSGAVLSANEREANRAVYSNENFLSNLRRSSAENCSGAVAGMLIAAQSVALRVLADLMLAPELVRFPE